MSGFVLQTNGSSSTAFPHPTDDPDDKLRGAFGRMDGDRLFAFLLWEVPGDRRFDDGLRGVEPLSFIQCAGSADALAVEVREPDAEGGYVLSTLGRADEEAGPQDVEIRWRGSSTTVFRNERWSSDDAAGLFLQYWRGGGAVPDNVTKRALESFDR